MVELVRERAVDLGAGHVHPSMCTPCRRRCSEARRDGLSVRAVGSRHSFTGAAVSYGVQLTMGRLARLVDVDQDGARVVVEAGMPIYRLNELLGQYGLAMPNLGDIDQQTISGAISTGTHGTGARLPGLAAQVLELELVLADGSVVTCSRDERPRPLRRRSRSASGPSV